MNNTFTANAPTITKKLPIEENQPLADDAYLFVNGRRIYLSAHLKPEIVASLATRVHQGEKSAEEELVGRYSRGLLNILRRKTNDDNLADDLHQDTFLIVLKRLRARGLDDPSQLAGFIHATAKNLVIAHFRKQARRKTEPDSAAIVHFRHNGLTQSDAAMRDEQAKMVRNLLDELRSERDHELLLRFYMDEEDKQSICNALSLTEKHFDLVMFRARERFRGLLLSARETH